MSTPRNCGDCSQSFPSSLNPREVLCPINDKHYDRNKQGCFAPEIARRLGVQSIERILWESSGLSPEAIKERGLPEIPRRVFTLIKS